METSELRNLLHEGLAIPALPLALDENRAWDKCHQRAVLRYYLDAGVGGIAVGVHSTQFEIRDPQHALFEPLLDFASREMDAWIAGRRSVLKIAGICGKTDQAAAEARAAANAGYHAGLLSVAAWKSERLRTSFLSSDFTFSLPSAGASCPSSSGRALRKFPMSWPSKWPRSTATRHSTSCVR
jgi:hypothetical protein